MSKGDKDRTTDKKAFDEGYERIFGKNQKVKQLQVDKNLKCEYNIRINWKKETKNECNKF